VIKNAGRQVPNVWRSANHQQRCNRSSDRRATVEERNRPSAFASRNHSATPFGRSGPVASLTSAEKKPKETKRSDALASEVSIAAIE
jgi:hypothetical protein